MSTYVRSILFRVAGAFAGMSLWTGLIVLALANFDSVQEFPDSLEVTWPFWAVALIITIGVYLVRRRLDPGPGWGAYVIGVMAPFVGLFLNANFSGAGGFWFWGPVLALILVPLASPRSKEASEHP